MATGIALSIFLLPVWNYLLTVIDYIANYFGFYTLYILIFITLISFIYFVRFISRRLRLH